MKSRISSRVVFFLALAAVSNAQTLNGLWDGTIKYGDFKVAFPVQFAQQGDSVSAAFFNGDDQVTSTSGHLSGDKLNVNFEHYASTLSATYADGVIKGTYGNTRNGYHDFEARPHQAIAVAAGKVPNIAGVWTIPNESPKGEHAWRLIIRQQGAEARAAILRVDGDTGALVGNFDGGKWVLNHFDGARAAIAEITPKEDGSLDLELVGFKNPSKHYIAVRADQAKAKGVPDPTDPDEHTRVRDTNEPFAFSFPDLNGKLVSNSDARFQGKVVIVNITGSWCPNCHDEAPFLVDLYSNYHSQGLEIVALDFEEPEQRKDPTRLQAFIKKYGIQYTYLLAGEPSELQAKLPQAVNLNSWPTTFFLGRDGKVRAIHAGFAAPASGEFNTALKKETTDRIEKLLSEKVQVANAAR
jgi:thiol-disulfide isomerase/thioredoxin